MVILGQVKKWCMVENLEVQNCTSINEFLECQIWRSKRGRSITGTWD